MLSIVILSTIGAAATFSLWASGNLTEILVPLSFPLFSAVFGAESMEGSVIGGFFVRTVLLRGVLKATKCEWRNAKGADRAIYLPLRCVPFSGGIFLGR